MGFAKVTRDLTERRAARMASGRPRNGCVRWSTMSSTASSPSTNGGRSNRSTRRRRRCSATRPRRSSAETSRCSCPSPTAASTMATCELPPHRPDEDHRHRPRGRGPAQGRLDLPHGSRRQRIAPRGQPLVHRHRPRHHRTQAIGAGTSQTHRGTRRDRPSQG